jgi:hypothetical protein
VVDGGDGVFVFFSRGGFAGDKSAGGALEGFLWLGGLRGGEVWDR